MSIKVSAYVWTHSKHRGTVKMLLLAMADFANDSGICWPSARALAERVNETERNVRLIIKRLVDDGDLLAIPGGGRGNTTHYAIAIGMSAGQKARLKSVLENTVSANTDTRKTVKSGDRNSEIWCQETVKSGDLSEAAFRASESAKPAEVARGIRHVDPSEDPEVSVRSMTEAPSASHTHTHPACQVYQELTGRAPNDDQAELIREQVSDLERWRKKIKKWLSHNYRADNVFGMLDWYNGKGHERANGASNGRSPPNARSPLPAEPRRRPTDALPPDEVARRLREHLQ